MEAVPISLEEQEGASYWLGSPKNWSVTWPLFWYCPASPIGRLFPDILYAQENCSRKKSDWFPAISVQAGPAMWVLGVAVIFEQYMIVWTVSFSFLVLSGCITGLGTLR